MPSDAPSPMNPIWSRYSRQILFGPIGPEGQQRLAESRVVIVGCGALGSTLAETLVRSGVGFVRICDRDFVELDNLQRQTLFDEDDVAAALPKAEAARRKLVRINSQVTVEGIVTDVNPSNIERLTDGSHLILDGTDNFETRYLINDVAVKHRRPWVYGAAVASSGLCLAVLPGVTPCLRCIFEEAPPPEETPTCETVGVLGTLVRVVASLQATEALKILMGRLDDVNRHLVSLDIWSGRFTAMHVGDAADRADCACCRHHRYEYLSGARFSVASHLCGRDAVQVHRKGEHAVDLPALADRLRPVARGDVLVNSFLLKVAIDAFELTVFPDGRAIIKGTNSPDTAKTLYARYVGL